MGQRLVITVNVEHKDITRLFNCYYHWSAYTQCSIDTINEIVKEYADLFKNYTSANIDMYHKITYCIFNAFFRTGAGIMLSEDGKEKKILEEINNEIEFQKSQDRNFGLIAITEKEMKTSQNWSEGDIHILIDKNGSIKLTKFDVCAISIIPYNSNGEISLENCRAVCERLFDKQNMEEFEAVLDISDIVNTEEIEAKLYLSKFMPYNVKNEYLRKIISANDYFKYKSEILDGNILMFDSSLNTFEPLDDESFFKINLFWSENGLNFYTGIE